MTADTLQRAAEKITRLCAEPRDLVSLWQESTEVLQRSVPHFWTPCFYTLDPASLLMTSHFHLGLDEFPGEWLAAEYYTDDVNQLADVARSKSGLSTLHEATNGDPASSPRWHRNMAMGGDQELVARLRTRSGEIWGRWVSTGNRGLRCSANPRRPSCSQWRRCLPKAPAPRCWWGRRASPTSPIRQDC